MNFFCCWDGIWRLGLLGKTLLCWFSPKVLLWIQHKGNRNMTESGIRTTLCSKKPGLGTVRVAFWEVTGRCRETSWGAANHTGSGDGGGRTRRSKQSNRTDTMRQEHRTDSAWEKQPIMSLDGASGSRNNLTRLGIYTLAFAAAFLSDDKHGLNHGVLW